MRSEELKKSRIVNTELPSWGLSEDLREGEIIERRWSKTSACQIIPERRKDMIRKPGKHLMLPQASNALIKFSEKEQS